MKIESIVYAGHSAVFVHTSAGVIAIDPWLEANPTCPEPLKNPEQIDLIVLTHGHSDHAGEAVRYAKRFGCPVAATYELAMIIHSEGVSESHLRPMNKGGTIVWNDLFVTLTNAFHSSSYDRADGSTVYAGEACGVVLKDENTSVYHAGDTCLFSDMQEIGKTFKPQVALLPIGDVFTMGPAEAAQAARLVQCRTAIPIHYNTFEMLTGKAEEFSASCKALGVSCTVLEPGGAYAVS